MPPWPKRALSVDPRSRFKVFGEADCMRDEVLKPCREASQAVCQFSRTGLFARDPVNVQASLEVGTAERQT